MDVLEDDNTCFVGAALKGDFDAIKEKFLLHPAYILYIDVAKVFKFMLIVEEKDEKWRKEGKAKDTYSLKDVFDYIYASSDDVVDIAAEARPSLRSAILHDEI